MVSSGSKQSHFSSVLPSLHILYVYTYITNLVDRKVGYLKAEKAEKAWRLSVKKNKQYLILENVKKKSVHLGVVPLHHRSCCVYSTNKNMGPWARGYPYGSTNRPKKYQDLGHIFSMTRPGKRLHTVCDWKYGPLMSLIYMISLLKMMMSHSYVELPEANHLILGLPALYLTIIKHHKPPTALETRDPAPIITATELMDTKKAR